MNQFNKATLAIFLPCIMVLCGCQDLVPHDTQSLLDPNFKRSEVLGLAAGFCRCAGFDRDVPASVKRGHEPTDGGHHGRLSDSLGLLRFIDCFATGDPMERDSRPGKFRQRRRVLLFRR